MLTLYDYLPSQNAYKVRLLLHHLKRPYRTQIVSIFEGEGQQADFLQVSPMGVVPAIRLDDGRALAESNAILAYLARGSRYLPDEPYEHARVLQWLFFERSYVGPSIATLRYWRLTGKVERQGDVSWREALGRQTLDVLNRELQSRPFAAGANYTIADMSLFAYVHLAADAGFSLDDHPRVGAWADRIRNQDGFLDQIHPYSIDPHSRRELP